MCDVGGLSIEKLLVFGIFVFCLVLHLNVTGRRRLEAIREECERLLVEIKAENEKII